MSESTTIGLPDEPGVYAAIPEDAYHSPVIGMVNKSALDQVERSPAHYRIWLEQPSRDTPALSFGRAFHCAVLEPERFAAQYVEAPDLGDLRRKENRLARDEWRAMNEGKIALSNDEARRIAGMRESVLQHPLASKMLRDGEAEMTLRWQDRESGLQCKSRLDFYVRRHAMIVDLKSTDDAREESFKRSIVNYRYHVQDALYRSSADALELPIEHFVLMAVEKSPPYAVATYTLDSDAIGKGYIAARRNMDTLAECVAKNHWPAYPTGLRTIELPTWA